MSRWLQQLALLVALSTGALACVTPSVPIPPPQPEKIFFALDGEIGEASFSYGPDSSSADAIVYVFNRDLGEGVITSAEADGSVRMTPTFPALEGNEIVVTFETESQLSSTCVTIRDGQSNSGLECEQ